jgi:hypothetical protein
LFEHCEVGHGSISFAKRPLVVAARGPKRQAKSRLPIEALLNPYLPAQYQDEFDSGSVLGPGGDRTLPG